MELDFSLINLAILFGGIQGLIFTIILLVNKKHPGAIFLAFVLVALTYNSFETFNWSAGLEQHIRFFDFYPFVTIFLLGPGFYCYFKSLSGTDRQPLSLKEILICFSPVIFQFSTRSILIATHYLGPMDSEPFRMAWEKAFAFYSDFSEPFSLLVFLIFTGLCFKTYLKFSGKKFTKQKAVKAHQEKVSWLRSLLICQAILSLGWSITISLPYLVDMEFGPHYYPIEIALVVFIYWLAYVGYFKTKSIPDESSHLFESPLPQAETNAQLMLLEKAMKEDKLFLNPELNLQLLASHTGIPPKNISHILNNHSGTNFNDFINAYRVNELCERLLLDNKNNLTLSGIAMECGFNSPATFQRAFKKLKGISPKEFLARQKPGDEALA